MRYVVCAFLLFAFGWHGHSVAAAQDAPTTKSSKPAEPELKWKALFDGKSLNGWKQTDFRKPGKVHVETNFQKQGPAILVDAGASLSGFNWTGEPPPKTNFEISLESMKLDGQDFMCGLTFPVGESFASLILGGWGGFVTGISSLDRLDASENETQKSMEFQKNHWYHVRMRVTASRLRAWVDEKRIVDVDITGKKVSLRIGDIEQSVPIGISTYQTASAFRDIKLRTLTPQEVAEMAVTK